MSSMSDWGLGEQHLLPDAIVAFVDGELATVPAQRAAAHIDQCACCAAEASTQRQARGVVRSAVGPRVPAALLNSLRSIPQVAPLPPSPDGLAVTENGALVAVQRPDKVFGMTAPLGSSAPLGASSAPFGERRHGSNRKTVPGASVVVSGLVLGALALVAPHVNSTSPPQEMNSRQAPVVGSSATSLATVDPSASGHAFGASQVLEPVPNPRVPTARGLGTGSYSR